MGNGPGNGRAWQHGSHSGETDRKEQTEMKPESYACTVEVVIQTCEFISCALTCLSRLRDIQFTVPRFVSQRFLSC